MDYKKIGLGFVVMILAAGITIASVVQEDSDKCVDTKAVKKIQEGVLVDGVFKQINDRAFGNTENVYVRGVGTFDDQVEVIVTKNRQWKCGDEITDDMIVASKDGNISDMKYLDMGKFNTGIYDVFVDEDGDHVYDCGKCNREIVDGKSFKCFGFEVVPELATAGLLGAGLVSMIGYVKILKR